MLEKTVDQTSANVVFSSFVDLLQDRAHGHPHQVAYTFVQGDQVTNQVTYLELDRQARSIAYHLQCLQAQGQPVLLVYPPGLEFIAAFFGCLYAGAIAVPAYPPRRNQSLIRLQSILASAQAPFVLTTTALQADLSQRLLLAPELAQRQWLATDRIAADAGAGWYPPVLTSQTLALLQYTSGSTGSPKGVMVSHGNLLHNSAVIHHCYGVSPRSQGVIWLPAYHDMGLIGGVLQPLYGGCPVVLMPALDFLQKPVRWLEAITRYQATTSGAPNFAYELCTQKVRPEQLAKLDLSSWEVAFTGAEPIQARTLQAFAQKFAACGFRYEAFYPCYGMAETTLIVTGGLKSAIPIIRSFAPEDLEHNQAKMVALKQGRQLVSCGRAVDQQVVIVDPETGHACADSHIGEIWVAGASVALGYWQQPTASVETFQAYVTDTGAGPYLRTGDLGFIQAGELFVTGRIKDLIIIRGQNYYPQDIELTVEQSHAALRPNAGAAFAVDYHEVERLVVVQEVEWSYWRNHNGREVINQIRQAVSIEHGISPYAIVLLKTNTISKTSSGKIQRHICRDSFLNADLTVVYDWCENPQFKTKFRQLEADLDAILQAFTTPPVR